MISLVVTLILTIVLCLAAAIGVLLAIRALRIRALFAIPVRPRLVPTPAEQVPPDLAEFLAQVVPELHALGFIAAASVHAPQMMATVTWTQVLFLRRDRGDRASVLLLRPTARAELGIVIVAPSAPTLVFATELPDGRSVKTATEDDEPPAPTSSASPPPCARVAALYERHRANVEKAFGRDAVGVVPESGREDAWLQDRAGVIAASMAEACGFVRDSDGRAHRPKWRLALRAAWATMRPRGTRRQSHGFDVVRASDKD